MNSFAIYTRQSVYKGDEFSSCDAQFMTCQDFAKAVGGPNQQWVGCRLDDEGFSGTTRRGRRRTAALWVRSRHG